MAKNRPAGSRKSPWFVVLLGFIVLVLAFTCLWLGLNDTPLTVFIPPPPPTPCPNALDYYLKADELLNTAKMPLAAPSKASVPMHGGMPAGAHVIASSPMRIAPPTRINQPWNAEPSEKFSPQQLAEVLTVTQPTLATLREGFNYPYMAPAGRSFKHRFPEYNKERDLARFLHFAAQTHAAHGDWGAAANCDLDALRLGSDIPKHTSLLGMLVGVAIQGIGREQLWETIPHLNAAQARAANSRLALIIARNTSLANCMQEEKWWALAGMQEVFQEDNWRKEFASCMGCSENGRLRWQLYFANKHDMLQGYASYMDKVIAETRKPYLLRQPVANPQGVLGLLAPVYEKASLKVAINDTENALMLCAFALQTYKAEHGVYPATLAALTPTYLTAIAADPFVATPMTALHYQLRGKKYLLYSIGPDGIDDGGRPIDSKDPKSDTRYSVFDRFSRGSSKGDIVAGINLN